MRNGVTRSAAIDQTVWMRELHYAGDSVHVSYNICDAVFNYARALANANQSDVVRIPIVVDGKREFSNMLLGPATSIFCTPSPDSDLDLEDEEILAYMHERTSALRPTQVQPESPGKRDHSGGYDEFASM